MSGRSTAEIVASPIGWWSHYVNAGKIHDHPDNPGRGWSHAMHRTCELVYPKLAAGRLAELEAEVATCQEVVEAQAVIGADLAAVALDALRLPCPTCGGTRYVDGFGAHDDTIPMPCPDCTDGRMSHERAWNIVAAVFDGRPALEATEVTAEINYLRAVR